MTIQTLERSTLALDARVGDIMTSDVLTIDPTKTVAEVATFMTEQNLRRVVVINQYRQVVGVVSQRDILKHLVFSDISEDEDTQLIAVGTLIGEKRPITVAPGLLLEKAAMVLAANKIGCLPVVDDDSALIGLLTITDLLRNLTGDSEATLETGFQFYVANASGSSRSRARARAFIRRTNGELVIPTASLEDNEVARNYVLLGYASGSGRILLKFVGNETPTGGAIKVVHSKEQLVIPAADFVSHYKLMDGQNAYDVSDMNNGRYIVLVPKPA